MKRMILVVLGGAIAVFVFVAFLKDFLYDSPQRCAEVFKKTLAASAHQVAESEEFEFTCVYKMNYMSLIPAGTLTMSKKNKERGPVFSVEALSDGSLADYFVHASVRLESYFDMETGMPYHFSETTLVNGNLKSKDIEFDRVAGVAERDGNKTRISGDTYDSLGAFVAAIKLSYEGAQDYRIRLLSKESIYILKAKKVAESKDYSQIAIEVKREDLTSNHGMDMTMWTTKGPVRIPLVFKSWSPAGYVSAALEKIEVMSSNKRDIE